MSTDTAPPTTSAEAQRAAGVHDTATYDGEDRYFNHERPELVALVPPDARRVLDVGCGSGALGAAVMRERPGCEVVGIEWFEDALAHARTRLTDAWRIDLNAFQELPAGPGTFDAIVCGDVLEHLLDPEHTIGVLRPYLAPGGRLIISVPNVRHWSVVFPLLVHDRFEYTDAGLLDRTHVHLFTVSELALMLGRAGYAVDVVDSVQMPVPDELIPLVQLALRLGSAPDIEVRMGAYQYLVTASAA
ncbi:MAG: class I SAM-dependent methyltransferase [Miltoncostaeaceae bacterium]